MNLISYILAIALVILAGVLIWWEYRLKYHFDDGRTIDHKRWRKRVLWLTLGLFVLNQINSLQKDHQFKLDKQESVRQINFLTNQLAEINLSQEKLSQENQRLTSILSTNSAVEPATRAAILNNQQNLQVIDTKVVNLNAWMTEWQNKRAIEQAKEANEREQSQLKTSQEQEVLDKQLAAQCNYIFEYAAATLQAMLTELARQQNESLASSYLGIPITISSNIVDLGYFSLGTNSPWKISLSLKKGTSESSPHCLRIYCDDKNNGTNQIIRFGHVMNERQKQVNPGRFFITLNILPASDKIVTTLQIPGEPETREEAPISDYGHAISEGLKNLFAAQALKILQTNNVTVP